MIQSELEPQEARPAHSEARAVDRPSREIGRGVSRVFHVSSVVWLVWATLVAALLAYVCRYGSNMPFHDEWSWIPQVTGDQPVTVSWLWSQHNEHRLPLPRLLYLALLRVSGNDFRAGMVFNALCLGAMAALLIVAVGRVRGKTTLSDAFLPLILLNGGQCENLLWNFQVGLVFPTLLAGVVLSAIAGSDESLSWRRGTVIGICLLAMTLCGAVGPAYAVPLGAWLGYAGLREWNSGASYARRNAWVFLTFAFLSLLMTIVYFIGYVSPAHHPRSPSAGATLLVCLQFLSVSLGLSGPGAEQGWMLPGMLTAGLVLASVVLLANVVIRDRGERTRALGLIAFLSAVAAVALGVGLGRAGLGSNAGLAGRYVTLAMPALVCVYVAWAQYGGWPARRLVPLGLCTLMAVLFVPNTRHALAYGQAFRQRFVSLDRDIRAGLPCARLGKAHTGESGVLIGEGWADLLAERMAMLKRARIGRFKDMCE
jgi:MFS family permease